MASKMTFRAYFVQHPCLWLSGLAGVPFDTGPTGVPINLIVRTGLLGELRPVIVDVCEIAAW